MTQLILHLIGDYVTQSDWMANNKTKRFLPAFVHAIIYSVPFLLITSLPAFSIISVTHFFIDRYRLARYVVYVKEYLSPSPYYPITATGYSDDKPLWLSVWLMIACDNTMHLAINYVAILYL